MVVAVALSLLIGLSLGLLGGGGSILTVPILVYALGQQPEPAIATSLLVVGATSAVAALIRARVGQVHWRTGLVFGAAGMAGAFVGGRLARFVPGGLLLLAFAAMMIATAVAMLRARPAAGAGSASRAGSSALPLGRVVLQGGGVGLVAGLVGAGGGFLVVPALVLLGGLTMNTAVGTSLLVITMQSFAGLAGHLGHTSIDWPLAGTVTASAIAGSLLGIRLGRRVSQQALRRGFAWYVLAMGLFVIGRESPPSVRSILVHRGALAVAALVVVMALVVALVRRIARNRLVASQRAGRLEPDHTEWRGAGLPVERDPGAAR
jgi:hypothetical protein